MSLHAAKSPESKPKVPLHRALHAPKNRSDEPTLAILPFLDLRRDAHEEHLAQGLAEELIQSLNQVSGLRVLSRTTTFLYAASELSLPEVGHRLQADALLSGSLVQFDDQLTLKASLLDVVSAQEVWSGTYDCDRKRIFKALEDISGHVASALHRSAPTRPRYAVDVEAYDDYLRGRHYYYRFNRNGMKYAAQMFRQALEIDPNYAPAWAGLANCAAYSYIYIERTEDQRDLAEACSRKALELDSNLAEAHASRGVALSAAGSAEEAESAFETALCLDPNLYEAAYFYARHCFAAGKAERAIEYFEWAAALRPEDFQAILLVAQVYHSLGVEDEAERARTQGLALVEERLKHAPDDVRARYLGANALVALGQREKGLAWARMARSMDPTDPMLLYNLGCIHALAGDVEEALDCLTAAIASGLSQKNWFSHDSDLDALRPHPRFQELMTLLEP